MKTKATKALIAGLLLSPVLSVHAALDPTKGYADPFNFNNHGKCSFNDSGPSYSDDSDYNYDTYIKNKVSPYHHLNTTLNERLLRGSYYSLDNQLFYVGGQNVPKYSGPASTGSAKAAPMAVQSGDWTYYIINGAHSDCALNAPAPNKGYERLVYAVGAYNHKTGMIKEPVIVHVKDTSDFHDTAVLNVDSQGYVYVFISGRNSTRGGLIYRSSNKHDNFFANLGSFKLVDAKNERGLTLDRDHNCTDSTKSCYNLGFTYPQAWWVNNKFVLLNTRYIQAPTEMTNEYKQTARRQLYMTEYLPQSGGLTALTSKKLVALDDKLSFGHYSVSTERNGVLAMAFNVHMPDSCTLKTGARSECLALGKNGIKQNRHVPNDNRTNLYFMYSRDGGKTWKNAKHRTLIDTSRGQYINTLNKLNEALLYQPDTSVDIVSGYDPESTTIKKRIYVKDLDITTNGYGGYLTSLKVLVTEADGIHGFVPKTSAESRRMIRALVIDQNGNKDYVGCYNSADCWADHAYSSGTVISHGQSGYSELAFPMSSGDKLAGGKVHLYNSNLKTAGDVKVWSYMGAQHYRDPNDVNYIRKVHDAKSVTGQEPVYFWAQSASNSRVDLVLSGRYGQQVQLTGNFGTSKKMACPTAYVFNRCTTANNVM
ncbi:BNR-4 repeat-containing protein [Pseudoalteromonas sp. PPB1]|uniref:BNR-4 repeat-containing protein n=1 Tax=Pseudoalteromonas sp. PPB1 TaxID=2756136 RepID=UPI001891E1CB|nr:BNR-4 repeat-containing protein [Pseudoalteromonas sp. PPB1]